MLNLRQILGMQPIKPPLQEHEMMARRVIRQLTVLGYEAYDVWEISAEMERLSLSAQENPDLFPPNQRPPGLRSPQTLVSSRTAQAAEPS